MSDTKSQPSTVYPNPLPEEQVVRNGWLMDSVAPKSSRVNLLDHGYVELIEPWGSDERIIESARMSTNKGFQGWETDAKLLKYLYEHHHMTPFEMCGLTVEVQAPIFVFREWHRHRTQSYNELSARYTELPDLFYVPDLERVKNGMQSKTNKQGSEAGILTDAKAHYLQNLIREANSRSRSDYELLLKNGVAREIARVVIPVSQYSRMRASANLRNWLAFLTLRMDPAAQWEIRQYANEVGRLIEAAFPRTWELFNGAK